MTALVPCTWQIRAVRLPLAGSCILYNAVQRKDRMQLVGDRPLDTIKCACDDTMCTPVWEPTSLTACLESSPGRMRRTCASKDCG